MVSIGLPENCPDPKLHEIRYSPEDNGFWLRFTAAGKEVYVLIDENKSGKESITYLFPYQYTLRKAYQSAKEAPDVNLPFEYPAERHGELVGTRGTLQISFLLPNGEKLGSMVSIGLPANCTDPKLHEIRYSPEDSGFWLKMSATTTAGRPKVVEFLLTEELGVSGKHAILETRVLGASEGEHSAPLPPEFRPTERSGGRQRTSRRALQGEVSAHVKRARNGVTFLKGEAFEQVAGVLLALAYPTERITPQYCLKVGLTPEGQGFFGMRADYRVGTDTIYEVKWGGATSNIRKTYERHTEQLKKAGSANPISYTLLLLQRNDDLRVPYTLFSDKLQGLSEDAQFLIQETQALITDLVESKHALSLGMVRDYLYDASLRAQEIKDPKHRTRVLHEKLSELVFQGRDNLNSFMKANTERFFNPLEAIFEWDGKLHTSSIDPLAYYQEHPDTFDIEYIFDAWNGREDAPLRRLAFSSQMDRDLAVACEVITDKPCGDWLVAPTHEDGVIEDPSFRFAEDLIVTTHPDTIPPKSGAQVVAISSLSDLRNHVTIPREEDFGDDLAWVEEYLSRFGGVRV